MNIAPILLMSKVTIVLLVILAVVIVALLALGLWGQKQQKKAEEQQKEIEAAAQPASMLIIDKKRMPLKDAGLPKIVLDSAPKMARRAKVPVVKAKIGPRIMTLMCDEKIFDQIPVKQEVKAMVSGIYIISVKNMRGPAPKAPEKVGFFKRMKNKITGK